MEIKIDETYHVVLFWVKIVFIIFHHSNYEGKMMKTSFTQNLPSSLTFSVVEMFYSKGTVLRI